MLYLIYDFLICMFFKLPKEDSLNHKKKTVLFFMREMLCIQEDEEGSLE